MEKFEEKLNSEIFEGCEDVLVGDVLHYSLNEEKSFLTGIKNLICIILKVIMRSSYVHTIVGDGSNMAVFSTSYRDRMDHLKAFLDITSLIDNKVSIRGIGSKLDLSGVKYIKKLYKWNKIFKRVGLNFGNRMCSLRDLLQAYKDYQEVEKILQKNKIKVRNLLVYCDVMPVDCLFTQKYKQKGCKTITFHHGAFSIETNAWAYSHSKSDFFLIDSAASCEDARSVGYLGEILTVGSPFQFHNEAIELHGPYRSDVLGIIMNSSADPIEDNFEMLKTVQAYCKKKSKHLYIKYHPADKAERYHDIIDESVVKGQYVKEKTVDEFLEQIDVAVASTSTAIKTSLGKNIPTLIFVRERYNHRKFRGTDELKFRNEDELEGKIKMIENDFVGVMERQNAYLNVLGLVSDHYREAYKNLGVL